MKLLREKKLSLNYLARTHIWRQKKWGRRITLPLTSSVLEQRVVVSNPIIAGPISCSISPVSFVRDWLSLAACRPTVSS